MSVSPDESQDAAHMDATSGTAELDAYTQKLLDVCNDLILAPSSNIQRALRTCNTVAGALPQRLTDPTLPSMNSSMVSDDASLAGLLSESVRKVILAIQDYNTRLDFMATYDLNCTARTVHDKVNAAISCVALGQHERLRTELRRQHALQLEHAQKWTANDDYNLVLAVQRARKQPAPT